MAKNQMTENQMAKKFIYFECDDCGFSSVQSADFNGTEDCPLCLADSGHSVRMSKREARDEDQPEGRDARLGESDYTIVTSSSASDLRRLCPNAPEKAEVKDPITREPDIKGAHGKAWLCDTEKMRRDFYNNRQDATLAHWIIEAPWAHPIWHSYSLVLIHLRPFGNAPSPKIYKQDATHEFWLYACDERADRISVIEARKVIKGLWLSPKQFAAQFIEITDELAMDRIRGTIQSICDGKLSPDVDAHADWVKLYGNSMVKEEYR